jgi:hypothetical protein
MEFKKIEDLEKEIDSYESWSKYVFWRLLKWRI